jgi:ABC-type Fe3+/spermidine/putrescine transport system ATPase subunit
VFQNYALYPHMNAARNMGFALKMRGVPKDEIDRRVRDAAQILGSKRDTQPSLVVRADESEGSRMASQPLPRAKRQTLSARGSAVRVE